MDERTQHRHDVLPASAREDVLDVLAGLGDELETGPLETLVRPLLRLLGELSGLESVYLTSIDWDQAVQHVEVARNTDDAFEVTEGLDVPWGETLCELSLRTGAGWNTDVPGTWGERRAAQELGIRSYVSVPVEVAGDGRAYGTLCGASPREVVADERVVAVLRLFAQMIATAIERDRAMARLESRVADAERRLGERISFAAQVEHAMKSPIAVVKGWVHTIRRRSGDAGVLAAGLDAIDATADRLAAQVGDLLAEARAVIGAGQVEDVEVRRLAEGLCQLVTDRPYEVDGDLVVRADPVAVGVLLEHLVENAVAHTPAGTAIRVLLGDGVLVVEDDGPGLPPGRDDLFEPFVSADPHVRGTGLGLHIVHSIAERLGAKLEAGAAESGGARFTVRFP